MLSSSARGVANADTAGDRLADLIILCQTPLSQIDGKKLVQSWFKKSKLDTIKFWPNSGRQHTAEVFVEESKIPPRFASFGTCGACFVVDWDVPRGGRVLPRGVAHCESFAETLVGFSFFVPSSRRGSLSLSLLSLASATRVLPFLCSPLFMIRPPSA